MSKLGNTSHAASATCYIFFAFESAEGVPNENVQKHATYIITISIPALYSMWIEMSIAESGGTVINYGRSFSANGVNQTITSTLVTLLNTPNEHIWHIFPQNTSVLDRFGTYVPTPWMGALCMCAVSFQHHMFGFAYILHCFLRPKLIQHLCKVQCDAV